jgi:hypothetical protein
MPIQIRILPQVVQMLEHQKLLLAFIQSSNQSQFTLFILLISVKGLIIFGIWDIILKFFGEKHRLSLHLVDMDTDLDPAK